jgi:2-isopropylmalate synthase
LSAAEIRAVFDREYVVATEPVTYVDHRTQHGTSGAVEHLSTRLAINGEEATLTGAGNGPVDAFVRAMREGLGLDIHVQDYHEHAVGGGEDATAVAYVQLRIGTERSVYGVGLDPNIVTATLRAVVSAVNRGIQQEMLTLPRLARSAYA